MTLAYDNKKPDILLLQTQGRCTLKICSLLKNTDNKKVTELKQNTKQLESTYEEILQLRTNTFNLSFILAEKR